MRSFLLWVSGMVARTIIVSVGFASCSANGAATNALMTPIPAPSPPVPLPTEPLLWHGTWTFEEAAPTGDCMANALNRSPHTGLAALTLLVRRADNEIGLTF